MNDTLQQGPGGHGAAALHTAPQAPAVSATPLLPPATLGVLGGGQLGRMFVHAAQAHGYRVVVLEPDPGSPAAAAADEHLQAPYDDPQALASLASRCQAVTTEFENVPASALETLARQVRVHPPASAVRVCQHRAAEKRLFLDAGVPCAPFAVIEREADVHAVQSGASGLQWPALLKTARLGYDGKGQVAVATADALPAAWRSLGQVPCVLEQRLPLALEFSVIVARGVDGAMVHLPPQRNLHRDGILAVTQVPAPDLPAGLSEQALAGAGALAQRLDYVGVLCVEFFVLQDGRLVANEMAPRPHNSGHASIEASDVSQFELQLRTLTGLPLVPPRALAPAVMLNLLGDLWFAQGPDAAPLSPRWDQVLALPGVHLHLYGKSEPRRGRKMGHLTVTAPSLAEARAVALQAAVVLGLPAF